MEIRAWQFATQSVTRPAGLGIEEAAQNQARGLHIRRWRRLRSAQFRHAERQRRPAFLEPQWPGKRHSWSNHAVRLVQISIRFPNAAFRQHDANENANTRHGNAAFSSIRRLSQFCLSQRCTNPCNRQLQSRYAATAHLMEGATAR